MPSARLTTHHTIIWRSVALIATQKKTHGASYVAFELHGFLRPAADFAAAEKLYPQMPEKGKPEKGTFCRTGIIMRRTPVCVRQCARPSMR